MYFSFRKKGQINRIKKTNQKHIFSFLKEARLCLSRKQIQAFTRSKPVLLVEEKKHFREAQPCLSRKQICAYCKIKAVPLAEGKKHVFSVSERQGRASRGSKPVPLAEAKKKRKHVFLQEARWLSRKQIHATPESKKTCFFLFSHRHGRVFRGSKHVPLVKVKKHIFFHFQGVRPSLSRKQICISRGSKSVPLPKATNIFSRIFSYFFLQKVRKRLENQEAEKTHEKLCKKPKTCVKK